MDAQADYTAVAQALARQLPPYVSYVVRSHAGFDALRAADSRAIVIRTSDGKIVSGKVAKIQVASGEERDVEIIRHPPFDPACYAGLRATLAIFESQPVEAIALEPHCKEHSGNRYADGPAFQTLYVDPVSHRPIAVVGDDAEKYVSAHLEQRFRSIDGFVIPTQFAVKVVGSGPMYWLNVDADQTYSRFRFSSTPPASPPPATPEPARPSR